MKDKTKTTYNFCIYGSASDDIDPAYILAGEELGRCLLRADCGMVFGGGAAGLMGAAARGVSEEADRSGKKAVIISVAPGIFNVDGVLYDRCSRMITTPTMRDRKKTMEDLSDGFIITPGGVGTLDEFFEIFTLRKLGQHAKPIAVYNIGGFYDWLEKLLQDMVAGGFLSEEALGMCSVFTDPEQMLFWLKSQTGKEADGRIC